MPHANGSAGMAGHHADSRVPSTESEPWAGAMGRWTGARVGRGVGVGGMTRVPLRHASIMEVSRAMMARISRSSRATSRARATSAFAAANGAGLGAMRVGDTVMSGI